MASYTLAGLVSSGAVGAGLGALGGAIEAALPAESSRVVAVVLVATVAAGALARELGLLRLPLPQLRRQTGGTWARALGQPAASLLWGFDLGLTFTTWLTYSGAWLVAVLAFATGGPAFGAAVLMSYWLGRALSVWFAPLLLTRPGSIVELVAEIDRERPFLHRLHVIGIGAIAVLAIVVHYP